MVLWNKYILHTVDSVYLQLSLYLAVILSQESGGKGEWKGNGKDLLK